MKFNLIDSVIFNRLNKEIKATIFGYTKVNNIETYDLYDGKYIYSNVSPDKLKLIKD